MNRIISIANRRTSVSVAAVIISLSYLASRLLGLFRDRLLASHFGIGPTMDAYTAAFRVPELLFTLLVSGAFAVAFIPVFTELWQKEERDEAWEVAAVLLNLLMLGTFIVCVLTFIFVDPITTLVAPGFDAHRHELTVNLTRIMLVTPFLFAISSVWGSIQQSFERFVFFAVASVFYNLGIIFGIVYLSPTHSIYGVAYGVVIGAAIQALVQVLGLVGLGYRYSLSMNFRHKGVIKIIKLMIPRSIDQGVDQINYIVETIIGSRLAPGSLTALYYANNLKNVPMVLIGNSIAVAAFPRMAARAAKGSIDKLLDEFMKNARLILFLAIPAATISVLLRGYIVRLLFGFGDPTTAATLGWFAGTIVFQALFFLITRVYYSMQDTRTPLYTSLVAIFINIFLSFILSDWFGVVGLAMAQSIVSALETIALVVILRLRLGPLGLRSLWSGAYRMIISNAIMAGVVYILVARVAPLYKSDVGFVVVAPKFFAICIISAAAYLIPCYLLELKEARKMASAIKEQVLHPLNLV